MSWSMRILGYVARTQKMKATMKYALTNRSATAATAGMSGPNGHIQPPRNSSAPNKPTTNVFTYSARKKIAQLMPFA